jgi:NADPH-dependent curcumin reductase CurA
MKQIVLKNALEAQPSADDFEMIDVDRPHCPEAGVVARLIYISLDPYVGSRLRGKHMGEPAPEPGHGIIPGAAVGQVVETKSDDIEVGDYVFSMEAGWREFAAFHQGDFRKIDPDAAPLSAYVGVLGMPGLTAWAGVTQLAGVHDGDVFMVDAAAGPVGGTAGQIARARGAKTVIGIAGGPEKCKLVTDVYGFDACLDYKAEGWQDELKKHAPDGISVHFENVGSEILAFAVQNMQLYARGVLCGLAAHYHADGPPAMTMIGPIVGKRASLHGLVVYDYYSRWTEFTDEFAPLVKAGKIEIKEDRVDGLEQAPALMEKLMHGKNFGKCVVVAGPEKL